MYKNIFLILIGIVGFAGVVFAQFTDGLLPIDLEAIDSPSDGEVPTYDSGSKSFEWAAGGGGGGGSGSVGTSTTPTLGQLPYWTSSGATPETLGSVATGTLSESVTGLEFNNSRFLIGGSAALSLTSGYSIPTTTLLNNVGSFYETPSTRITAGTGLTWSTNTINLDNDFGASIDSSEITDGTIVNADINASAAIDYSKLSLSNSIVEGDFGIGAPTNGYILIASSSATGAMEWTATTSNNLGLVQNSDLHDAVTVSGTPNYVTLSGQDLIRAKLDLTDDLNTFSEANLYTMLTDVTQFYESGDEDTIAGLISTGALANGIINEPDLDADVAAVDGDFLQYDSTGTNFTWRSGSETLSDIGAEGDLANEAGLYAALSDVTQFWEAGDTLSSGAISSGFGNIDIGASNLDADGTITFGGLTDCDTIDTSATGVFSCGTDATGEGIATTSDVVGLPGTPETVGYFEDDFMIGGSSSTTAEFLFDPETPKLTFNSATSGDNFSILAEASGVIRLGSGTSSAETIDIDGTTSNRIEITSNSGATLVDFNTLDLLTDKLTFNGTGTIEGLDSLDATSESTIEVAIDTLTNLVTVGTITTGTWSADLAADTVDAITEIAAALKSGADATLVTGTAGTNGNLIQWNADGDAVDASIAASNVCLLNGSTFTGVHDFGGATSLEIPNGTGPTVDTTGEIALDTTQSQWLGYNGSSVDVFMTQQDRTLGSIGSTSQDRALNSFDTGTTTWSGGHVSATTTVSAVFGDTDAGTCLVRVGDGTNWSTAVVADSDGQELAISKTFNPREEIQIEIGSCSSSPNYVTPTITQSEDRQ